MCLRTWYLCGVGEQGIGEGSRVVGIQYEDMQRRMAARDGPGKQVQTLTAALRLVYRLCSVPCLGWAVT